MGRGSAYSRLFLFVPECTEKSGAQKLQGGRSRGPTTCAAITFLYAPPPVQFWPKTSAIFADSPCGPFSKSILMYFAPQVMSPTHVAMAAWFIERQSSRNANRLAITQAGG
jgi:hypothetical protein